MVGTDLFSGIKQLRQAVVEEKLELINVINIINAIALLSQPAETNWKQKLMLKIGVLRE